MARKIRHRRSTRTIAVCGAAAAVVLAILVPYLSMTWRWEQFRQKEQDGLFVEENRQAVLSYGDHRVMLTDGEQESGWEKYVESVTGEQVEQVSNVKIEIPFGGMYMLRLDDGTAVWLNSGSSLEYPRTFDSNRRSVVLHGEGYFEVAPDAERPFEIAVHEGLAVKVLGTKFNVSAYDNIDYTTVTLAEGMVELQGPDGAMELSPNQQAVFDRATGVLAKRPVPDAMAHAAWIHGVFDFKGERLNEMMDALAQWYGVTVTYDDSIDIVALGHFTMKVGRNEDLYIILSRLGAVTGLDYKIDSGEVHISPHTDK